MYQYDNVLIVELKLTRMAVYRIKLIAFGNFENVLL